MNDSTDYSSIEKTKDVQIVELQCEIKRLTAEKDRDNLIISDLADKLRKMGEDVAALERHFAAIEGTKDAKEAIRLLCHAGRRDFEGREKAEAEVAKLQAGFKLRGEALESQKLAAVVQGLEIAVETARRRTFTHLCSSCALQEDERKERQIEVDTAKAIANAIQAEINNRAAKPDKELA